MWEFEREMYEREMKSYYLEEEEDEDDWNLYKDSYYDNFYEHEDYA